MYMTWGLKASQLISELQKLIDKHGDQLVVSGGGDYPEGVGKPRFNPEEQPYYPKNCFIL